MPPATRPGSVLPCGSSAMPMAAGVRGLRPRSAAALRPCPERRARHQMCWGMGMQKIFESVVLPALFGDVRLNRAAQLVWLRMHFSPVNTLSGHVKAMGVPKETLRRAVRMLIENQWAMEF